MPVSGQKSVLGKGLASLLPGATLPAALSAEAARKAQESAAAIVAESNRDRHPGISIAAVEEISVNPYQPRREFSDEALEELAQSIRANGIIQPLVVRKGQSGYVLIAGERRLRAAKRAGLKQVPVVIRKSTDREALELALIENIQREDLNCIDEALAYFQLGEEFTLTQEEIATRVGKDRATVANHLRLLRLPEAVIEDLKNQVLTFGHGKVLCGVEDPELRFRIYGQIVQNKLSVRETEALIEQWKAKQAQADAPKQAEELTPVAVRLQSLSQELTRKFSAKVEIRGSDRKGKVVVHYANREELERILTCMQN